MSAIRLPFETRSNFLPRKGYMRHSSRILFDAVKDLIKPKSITPVRFKNTGLKSVGSFTFNYDDVGINKVIKRLTRKGFIPIRHRGDDRRKPGWLSVEKTFELNGLEFRAQINFSREIDRAQIKTEVGFAGAMA